MVAVIIGVVGAVVGIVVVSVTRPSRDAPIKMSKCAIAAPPTTRPDCRRMFPGFKVSRHHHVDDDDDDDCRKCRFNARHLQVRIKGLDPKSQYHIMMDIVPVDVSASRHHSSTLIIIRLQQHRYKFHNSKWGLAGKADPECDKPMHVHPDSGQDGETWMRKGASFTRVKVTNNMTNRNEFVSGRCSRASFVHPCRRRRRSLACTTAITAAAAAAVIATTRSLAQIAPLDLTRPHRASSSRVVVAAKPLDARRSPPNEG